MSASSHDVQTLSLVGSGQTMSRLESLLHFHSPGLLKNRRPVSASRPQTGRNSEIWLVDFDDGLRAVVRVSKTLREARRLGAWLRKYQGAGLPVPDCLERSGLLRGLLRHKEGVVVEEYIDGRLLAELEMTRDVVMCTARALARLHSEVRSNAGQPDQPRRRNVHARLLQTAISDIDKVVISQLPSESHFNRDSIVEALRSTHADLHPLPFYSLVHNRIGPSDVILPSGGGDAVFLDCGSLQYGHFAPDLFDVLGILVRSGNGEYVADFVQTYYEFRKNLPPGQEFETIAPFFELAMHVRRLRSFTTKAKLKGDRAPAEIARALKGIDRNLTSRNSDGKDAARPYCH